MNNKVLLLSSVIIFIGFWCESFAGAKNNFNDELMFNDSIPNTRLLQGDVEWEKIILNLRKFHENRLDEISSKKHKYWKRDFSSKENYNISISKNRNRLREILGAIDAKTNPNVTISSEIAVTENYTISEIRWSVLKEIVPYPSRQYWPKLDVPKTVNGEGLLLQPHNDPKGFVIAVPDADQSPESICGLNSEIPYVSHFARRLVENGYVVIVPVIVDRSNEWSRGTNRPSRSWIYSQAYELGRSIVGYEVQKIESLLDWIENKNISNLPVGIVGYGEGGLLSLYTSALDTRIDVTLVSGYFAPRNEIWKEPIYRNLWGLLKEFGDAEIASMVAPRKLIIEYSQVPEYDNSQNHGKEIEPEGCLWTHEFSDVRSEFEKISFFNGGFGEVRLIHDDGNAVPFCSSKSMTTFMDFMKIDNINNISPQGPADLRKNFDPRKRMGRMVEQMVGHTQLLLRNSEYERSLFADKMINDGINVDSFFRNELIGYTEDSLIDVNPRSRLIEDDSAYSIYEVTIDVLPNVKMWGYMGIPKNIAKGERHPLVVVQHGRGGYPWTSFGDESGYFGLSRDLINQGIVVFSPFGNWTGESMFRWIDRIARPAKNTIWSTVTKQHEQLIRWLKSLSFVDSNRIGFYGKSIGGQAASLIPALIKDYAMSINCAYFNESARKESSIYYPTSFVFHVDSEMPMWNRGNTLEYAEIANYMMFPRPFMVEHGRADGIAPPEWVVYEFSKVQNFYQLNEKEDYLEFDLHKGGHIINKVVSYPFLRKHLDVNYINN